MQMGSHDKVEGWSVIVNPMRSMALFDDAGSGWDFGVERGSRPAMLALSRMQRGRPRRTACYDKGNYC
jgi:hypothetical protein